MPSGCTIVTVIFVVLYLFALALLLIGTFGLFGQEKDPLSGVFLVPLGLPWNQFLGGFSDRWLPWLAAGAPLVNAAILITLCRIFKRAGGV
ncbi:hypothetical protein EJA01_00415 [Rhodovulum iodosum]|nr:hypothetical protein EJA01_00415 [Rhodovulum robiginosum]